MAMAIEIGELPNSRSLDGPNQFTWRYWVTGTSVIDSVATALYNASPTNYGFWLRMWDQKTITPNGGGSWNCEVPYGVGDIPNITIPSLPSGSLGGDGGQGGAGTTSPPAPADGDALGREWTVDISLGTRLRTKSIQTFGGWCISRVGGVDVVIEIDPREDGEVIGYNPETGEVAGVEVPTAVMRLELQAKVPVLTMGYIKQARNLIGKVNIEAFLGYPAGEVKLAGAAISWSNANGFTIRYTVDIAKNQTGVIVSEDLPPVDVKGWEYLDVTYATRPNTEGPSGSLTKVPIMYVVHQVILTEDLNLLFS